MQPSTIKALLLSTLFTATLWLGGCTIAVDETASEPQESIGQPPAPSHSKENGDDDMERLD